MKETGTITKISDKTVTVKVKRRNECSKCGLCGMKDGQSEMDFIASYGDYQNNLAVGDTVVVESAKDLKFISYLLVFIIPLCLIGLSLFIGYAFFSETVALIASICSVIGWYVVLAFIDKLFGLGKNYGYIVTEKLSSVSDTMGE